MRILKDRKLTDSPWQLDLSTDANDFEASREDFKIVSLDKWLKIRASNTAKNHQYGIFLAANEGISLLSEFLHAIPVIALNMEKFTEGRGYSQAVELREAHCYTGEIRAINPELDNLAMLERCGVNAFQFEHEPELDTVLQFLHEIKPVYEFQDHQSSKEFTNGP